VIVRERLRHMLVKEFIQALRDPKMKAILFVMPVVQLIVFGYAVTTDVRDVRTAVFDLDETPASRDLISRFAGSGYFRIVEYLDQEARAQELLDRSDVSVVLRMNKGFEEDLRSGRTAKLQLLLDGTDSNTAGIVLNYAARVTGGYSRKALESRRLRLAGTAIEPGRVEVATRAWFNENLESRNFYVPGVVAILVTLITLLLTSMAVVREKEIGTMEQIMVTPIRPVEFILGKTLPFALISFLNVFLVTTVGVLWFGVPVRGNLLLLFLATALFLLTALGVGLVISTISQTQQQAMMGTFFFYMPAMLLSGFMFPIAHMPEPVQWLTLLNPLRYFLVIIRGIFLKGVGLDILWPQMAALAVIGVFTLGLASRRFRKTLA
jgi:ABC-2 type transport system permease protein